MPKIGNFYLHFPPLIIGGGSLLIVVLGFNLDFKEVKSLLFFILPFLILLILCLILLIRYSKDVYYPKNPSTEFEAGIEFISDKIYFNKAYQHRNSSFRKNNCIPVNLISEVNLIRWPREMVIQEKEVFFVSHVYDEELKAFCKANIIPIIERFDVWEAISRPYLDVELDKEEEELLFEKLKENGFEKEEVLQIRKKVSFGLLTRSYFSMEYIHYGQEDVLEILFPTKNNYWWTMEISLRNLNKD